ncbi:hypothetical protein Gogos_018110, partial [Gossypium gossypioides]|nr:hypothetical protein [Gossypium gossypioides]
MDCRRYREDELKRIWQSWGEAKKTCFWDKYGDVAQLLCLYKHFRQVFVPSTKPIEEFLESEWPLNQSIEEWVQNLSILTYQEIEWKAGWMVQSTIKELKKESTPFAARNQLVMKLLEVGQGHYQKCIKLMRRKKKNRPRIAHRYNTRSKAKKMKKEELVYMAKLEEQMEQIMEMMTTMVKGKAKVKEQSGTLDNPIPLYDDTR